MSAPAEKKELTEDQKAALKKEREERKKAKAAQKLKKKDPPKEAPKEDGKEKKEGKGKGKEKELRLKKEFVNPTPKGEKKDMSAPMADAYDPPAVEAAWYDWWVSKGYFRADNATKKEKFVMVIPPPNVTGYLHLGHALMNSIEDVLVRWHRMCGREALWVPGTDHAGIATQVRVEKKIQREQGLTRHDLGRENFVAEVWRWKEKYGGTIIEQLRRMGSSLDWSRECFTMDEKLSRAVLEAFVRLHDAGLIYRDTRLVNWCCALNTAISDIEVEDTKLEGPTHLEVPGHPKGKKYEFGVFVKFAYKIENSNDEIVVATTRPETMLGDTAIAVHSTDERYKHLHGKFAVHPFIPGRRMPIVLDDILVDPTTGTGAVKITPAHDRNDYACGKRNNLEFINILNDNGTINENGGEFKGMMRFDARDAVVKRLKEVGLYRETVPNPEMNLPRCSRSNDVIEPLLKPQWWVNCKGMAAESVAAVREGRLQIYPEFHKETWYQWLENIQDWCVSRQLWWGHRIPAYLVTIEGRPAPNPDLNDSWVIGRNYEEALSKAKAKYPEVPESAIKLHQDPDVLDTWFSSGIFPFSVFGWPDNTVDLEAFFPTSVLETGHDILFFWVARMVMMSLQLTKKLPFSKVLLHALVRDAHGRKMTKSLGNVIDPLDVIEGIPLEELHGKVRESGLDPREEEKAIEGQKRDFPKGISECGTDSLRFTLCSYTAQGRNINLNINRAVVYRNFCNKLWNATRFALNFAQLGTDFTPLSAPEARRRTGHESPIDRWILSRLNAAIEAVNRGVATFELAEATEALHRFWYGEVCDVYLEVVKPHLPKGGSAPTPAFRVVQQTLYTLWDYGLRLLHPFMPFVSEELFQRLPRRPDEKGLEALCIAPFPTDQVAEWTDAEVERDMKFVDDLSRGFRALRGEYNLDPKVRPPAFISASGNKPNATIVRRIVQEYNRAIEVLSFSKSVALLEGEAPLGCVVHIFDESITLFWQVKDILNVANEITKLEKKIEQLRQQQAQLQKRMDAPTYASVPEDIKEQNSAKMTVTIEEAAAAAKALENFKKLATSQ